MMAERGVVVDHATVHWWSIEILPVLAAVFRRRKRPVSIGWRMDETHIKVGGQCNYLYRAVDRAGAKIDLCFGLTETSLRAVLLRARRRTARRQVFSQREHPLRRHRDDAHDQEGTARPSQNPSFDRRIPVLLARHLIIGRSPHSRKPHAAIATEPFLNHRDQLVDR